MTTSLQNDPETELPKKVYYTVSEVAKALGEAESCIRHWCKEFAAYVKPHRNKGNDRLFTPRDVETLRSIRYLRRERGMSVASARETLAASRRTGQKPEQADICDTPLAVKAEVISRLQNIKERLLAIDSYLKENDIQN
ncbi:MAG: MerR family transcriptional regulator [Bacteroidales bacterium]|nr:MerR family transcriptional regulator [Bacteroidales bacterium]